MKLKIITYIFFVFLLTLFAFSPLFYGKSAVADSDKYLRVITDDTPFYADKDGKEFMFYLQYTYYVKVINRGTTYTQIECYGDNGLAVIDGYAPTDMLFEDGLTVASPYPNVTVTTATTAVLYSDCDLTRAIQYVFSGRELKYYGRINVNGENAYFISYNNRLGYVKESEIIPFVIDNHPNELTFLKKDEPTPLIEPDDNSTNTNEKPNDINGTDTVRILIFSCLGFAGVVALFIALKPKTRQGYKNNYYDENDYE